MTDPRATGTIDCVVKLDMRRAVEGLQGIEHAFERAGLAAREALNAWWKKPATAQVSAERWEALTRRQAAERLALLERHRRDVCVITGYDGVTRVVER